MDQLRNLSLVAAVGVATVFIGAGTTSAEQKDPRHPAISGYGQITPIPKAQLGPQAGHRAIFDLAGGADSPAQVSPGLEELARYVNLLASQGLSAKKAPVVAVLHGNATDASLDHAAYQSRHGIDNPNLELVGALAREGVRLYVCGQALAQLEAAASDTAPDVEVALSAMNTLTAFQQRGYALIPQ